MPAAAFHVDAGSSGPGGLLFGRPAGVALASGAGDVTFGRHYSPLFFTLVTYGLGGGMGWGNASNYFTDNSVLRVNNSVSYASPSFAGFKARALVGLGENTTQPGANIGNVHSISLQYDSGPLSANLAFENRKTTAANTDRFYAAGASYVVGTVKASVLAQSRRDDLDAARNDVLEIGLSIPVGPGALLVDAGRLRNRSVADADARALSIRYDYNLSKRSMLYAGAATIRNGTRSRFGINGNTGAALTVAAGDDPRSLILGVRHTF
jgi:predicted porin